MDRYIGWGSAEKIKEDTYYRCIEGEIVEVTEDGEIVEE